MIMSIVNQNSDFLFLFQATMTNPNGDPDQENKPRMDYETMTLLVSDARRKRDCRDFLKEKKYHIFVDTLDDKKVPMDIMFENIRDSWLSNKPKIERLFVNGELKKKADDLFGVNVENYKKAYDLLLVDLKKKEGTDEEKKKRKANASKLKEFNNLFLTEIIKGDLIDIRLFGSAMAVEGITKTFTGPIQINWGYSLHPVELVKSNTITTIMNDDSSTFGKKHKVYYALVAHHGIINKYAALKTGMTDTDRDLFRKALVQGMLNNQTDSKQGQEPLLYLEVMYKPEFDGYLGDLRRFIKVTWAGKEKEDNIHIPIRSFDNLSLDFTGLQAIANSDYVKQIIIWMNPIIKDNLEGFLKNVNNLEQTDLLAAIKPNEE
jgi:CRISPR-associated protein Csh2